MTKIQNHSALINFPAATPTPHMIQGIEIPLSVAAAAVVVAVEVSHLHSTVFSIKFNQSIDAPSRLLVGILDWNVIEQVRPYELCIDANTMF